MASEPRRGCGYRKVGGLYLVAPAEGWKACDRFPIKLTICPCCNAGFKQSRGWTWVNLNQIMGGTVHTNGCTCPTFCPVCNAYAVLDRVGLLWIGESFYPMIADYQNEAHTLGISRRIRAVPRGFKVGESWVALAHPKGFKCGKCAGSGMKDSAKCLHCNGKGSLAAIFRVFKPTAIEKLITASEAADPAVMEELAEKGITLVVVPDNDRDHQGTVYDDESAAETRATDAAAT